MLPLILSFIKPLHVDYFELFFLLDADATLQFLLGYPVNRLLQSYKIPLNNADPQADITAAPEHSISVRIQSFLTRYPRSVDQQHVCPETAHIHYTACLAFVFSE
jgi:hypothetical protein